MPATTLKPKTVCSSIMRKSKNIHIDTTTSIQDAIRVIDQNAMQIALVVDDNGRILGTVTDGDIRRAILKGCTLQEEASQIMNPDPVLAHKSDNRVNILALMRKTKIHHIPVVDDDRVVLGIETIDDILGSDRKDNTVVIMAGGLGSRLRPLTNDCPKPLLKIGDKPILETIMESFISYGFHNFFFSVCYMADMVESHFGDGADWGVNIQYIKEQEPLGTAGSLANIPGELQEPIIVMNGDLLTKLNFQSLLDFHNEHRSMATMCVREYDFQVPYGVVDVDGYEFRKIIEKPVHRFFVNAGIYVIDPQMIDHIPKNTCFDMPDLFSVAAENNLKSAVLPIREYWLDIGRLEDYERAKGEYVVVFDDK
jgi:dTDP-glucose pyrophosphorylase/CBS domain-containing protein